MNIIPDSHIAISNHRCSRMNNHVIFDGRVVADRNFAKIRPDHGTWPDAAIFSQHNISDYAGCGMDKRGFGYLWSFTIEALNHFIPPWGNQLIEYSAG
jgi:hypothetical protein